MVIGAVMKAAILAVVGAMVLGVLVLGGWLMGTRNTLVDKDEAVRASWSQVENAYQRRADLIPNLVETVKGAANFEQSTFTQISEARARAGSIQATPELLEDPAKFRQFEEAQRQLGAGLSRLLATAEAYPDLKANANFRDLQAQLEGTENRIAVERRRFNETVSAFNVSVRRFPGSLAAALFGFSQKSYFQADAGAEQAPQVKF